MNKAELNKYRRNATRASIDLGYPDEVRSQIETAQTEGEIHRIMTTARQTYFGDENWIERRKKEVERERRRRKSA